MAITSGLAGATTLYSSYKVYGTQKKGAQAQKEGIEGQKAMQDLELRKARLDARRQARAARAAVLTSGEAAGVAPSSSAVAGSVSSVKSSEARNDNFLQGMGAWQGYVLDKQSEVVGYQQEGNKWQAIGALSSTIFAAATPKRG
jgi:hypothetical protein